MIAELSHFALILAFVMALLQATVPLYGVIKHQNIYLETAAPLVIAQAFFLTLSFLGMVYLFISNDFSVLYIAENSHRDLPFIYRMCAVWGAHEGSLLLWVLLLSFWSVAVSRFSKSLDPRFLALMLSILAWVTVGFLLFLLFTSNPFKRLLPDVPANGLDLNPLLQDPGFVGHPPMLYMGYVGFAIPFAFALASLISGGIQKETINWVRPWALIAWSFLTLGITLGSWWAYRELGWGGFWFWDPVENASFLPWLIGTALIHSLMVTQKRQNFQHWTLLLAIIAFALSLLGTFLVRSGVITSVHAFASDPTRGVAMLIFLGFVIGTSLFTYALRAPKLPSSPPFYLCSREMFLLFNNLILLVAMLTVLLGTLYPLMMDVLALGKISVGPPYFNFIMVPLTFLTLFLMAIGIQVRWKQDSWNDIYKKIIAAAIITIIATVILLFAYKRIAFLFGIALSIWVIASTLSFVFQKLKSSNKNIFERHFWGMTFAHIGLAIFVIGVTALSTFQVERDVKMQIGETVQLADYEFSFVALNEKQVANYQSIEATFLVKKQGKIMATLYPEKRFYPARKMMMTDAAIKIGIFRDIYIALGESLSKNSWSVRLYIKPFIRWIWFGGFFMVAGALISAMQLVNRKQGT